MSFSSLTTLQLFIAGTNSGAFLILLCKDSHSCCLLRMNVVVEGFTARVRAAKTLTMFAVVSCYGGRNRFLLGAAAPYHEHRYLQHLFESRCTTKLWSPDQAPAKPVFSRSDARLGQRNGPNATSQNLSTDARLAQFHYVGSSTQKVIIAKQPTGILLHRDE